MEIPIQQSHNIHILKINIFNFSQVFINLPTLHKKRRFPLRIFSVNVTKLRIWSRLLKKSLMEIFAFCAVRSRTGLINGRPSFRKASRWKIPPPKIILLSNNPDENSPSSNYPAEFPGTEFPHRKFLCAKLSRIFFLIFT